MATITVPSPAELLGEARARAASPPKITVKPASKKQQCSGVKKVPVLGKAAGGVGKVKQTKSRNGCATCKEKRLKCDEGKPTCEQCRKRGVNCAGYNKVFQWRPEEKATFRTAPVKSRRRSAFEQQSEFPFPNQVALRGTEHLLGSAGKGLASEATDTIPIDPHLGHELLCTAGPQLENEVIVRTTKDLRSHCSPSEAMEHDNVIDRGHGEFEQRYVTSAASLGFEDYLFDEPLPFCSDESFPSFAIESFAPVYKDDWSHGVDGQNLQRSLEEIDGDVEQMVRHKGILPSGVIGYPSPSPSDSSASSDNSTASLTRFLDVQPAFGPCSTEMLINQFSKLTCGILSIKDGTNENPWRTMLLPMAASVPSLHFAILSMAAFHLSRAYPRFRPIGIMHMNQSIHYLLTHLGDMRKDTALATSLVLAFSESWDQETSTGMQHLRGARKLVTQAVANHEGNADFDELERLKFLRNTWVYMDVIARITAIDGDDLDDLDAIFAPVYGPASLDEDLDPLMGCATSFFPLLGRVANLVRRIRKTKSSSPTIVARAASIRSEILRWKAPAQLRAPNDESIEIDHSLKTAEAYRWATLLFLYQAVSMIATESLPELAEKVMYHLVCVPTTSRLVIIHIFPLLVAGCELIYDDNRQLVQERWAAMTQRMTIGNLDRCLDVVQEVWRRRDARFAELGLRNQKSLRRQDKDVSVRPCQISTVAELSPHAQTVRPCELQRPSSEPIADIDFEFTVRGTCHWLTVMKDWNWAVLLG